MSAEAIIAIIAVGVTVIGALIAVLIRVFVALQKLTDATERLISTMDDHDNRLDKVEVKVEDHESRIGRIETIHAVKGCVQ